MPAPQPHATPTEGMEASATGSSAFGPGPATPPRSRQIPGSANSSSRGSPDDASAAGPRHQSSPRRRGSGGSGPLSRDAERIRQLEAQVNHLRRQNSQLKLQAAFGRRLSSSSSMDDSIISSASAAELLDETELIEIEQEIADSVDEWLFVSPGSARSSRQGSRCSSPRPSPSKTGSTAHRMHSSGSGSGHGSGRGGGNGGGGGGGGDGGAGKASGGSPGYVPNNNKIDTARQELNKLRTRLAQAFDRAEATPINQRAQGRPSRVHKRSHTVPNNTEGVVQRSGGAGKRTSKARVPRLPKRDKATGAGTVAAQASTAPSSVVSSPAVSASGSPTKPSTRPLQAGTPEQESWEEYSY